MLQGVAGSASFPPFAVLLPPLRLFQFCPNTSLFQFCPLFPFFNSAPNDNTAETTVHHEKRHQQRHLDLKHGSSREPHTRARKTRVPAMRIALTISSETLARANSLTVFSESAWPIKIGRKCSELTPHGPPAAPRLAHSEVLEEQVLLQNDGCFWLSGQQIWCWRSPQWVLQFAQRCHVPQSERTAFQRTPQPARMLWPFLPDPPDCCCAVCDGGDTVLAMRVQTNLDP